MLCNRAYFPMELLPFVDILKVFNNPINEEQAWAVCYQCAHFLQRNPSQEFYQDVYISGIHSIWLSRHGDVLLRKGPPDPNGSGKGPPHRSHFHHGYPSACSSSRTDGNVSSLGTTSTAHHSRKGHVLAGETEAVQALGTAIFEALDYGIDQSEERQLSPELETMIVAMTSSDADLEAAANGDDEGIENDADVDAGCTVLDVIKLCVRHVSSKQDASHHYKAVCRALATEAGELFTFLDKVSAGKEQLTQTEDEDARRLEELQRADWACLWVQVMRSLRQGVRLKKVEHVHMPPLEYELTPFEMILEDIRSRRYTLTKIMVNGDIPHKVKNDAHAVILNFIRSRPPLKKVDDRKLKPKPPSPPDPHEMLLREIRSRPKLRPVKNGKLVVGTPAETSMAATNARVERDDSLSKTPTKRVIKPDFNLLINNSFEESSDDEDRSSNNSPATPEHRQYHRDRYHQQQQQQQQLNLHPRSDSMSETPSTQRSWQRAVTRESLMRESKRPARLKRRHTITVCEAPLEHQVALTDLPVLQEEEEEQQQPSPVRDNLRGGSSISQTGEPHLPRCDNDVQSQGAIPSMTSTLTVNLRQAPNLVRRASFDQRRCLISQGSTGLTSIPEQEDDGKGGSGPLSRDKSREQCPPPNPSPPCKGRSKTGLAMVGMKPSGGPYHPGSHRSQTSLLTGATAATPGAAALTTSTAPMSMLHAFSSNTSSYGCPRSQHANSTCSVSFSRSLSSYSSSSSSSSLPSPSSPEPLKNVRCLDISSSSQSPHYRKISQQSNLQAVVLSAGDSEHKGGVQRWRTPVASPNNQGDQTSAHDSSMTLLSSSARRWAASIGETGPALLVEDGSKQDTGYSPDAQDARQKRLSLDSGMSLYYEEALRDDGPESLPTSPQVGQHGGRTRKTSVGLARTGYRRMKTPEEEEHVRRWRTLQEDEHQARLSRKQPTLPRTCGVPVLSSPSPTLPESTDVLQQRMAGEEERFDRWRRLEEGTCSHPLVDHLNPNSPLASPNMDLTRHRPVSSTQSQPQHGVQLPRQQSLLSSFGPVSDSTFLHDTLALPKRWKNPVECLSLTLEEVTHIRSVLTKAELESLMSHPDLYQQVAKNKLCFTCKTTRFALFGEWGTKCKFCKRTVCSKCLRKMNVPADHFRNIPVYALSPTPLTQEMQDFIQEFIRGGPAPSVPCTRDHSPIRPTSPAPVPRPAPAIYVPEAEPGQHGLEPNKTVPGKALYRSQSAVVAGHRSKLSATSAPSSSFSSTIKGPVMAICCDCKGMVMEIIRATRASLTLLSSAEGKATLSQETSFSATSASTPLSSSVSLNQSARYFLARSKLVPK